MKILCFGYRPWALKIYENIKHIKNAKICIMSDPDKVSLENIKSESPDIILFYGWSWKVSGLILQRYKCLMLHPSDLPRYRGGSPIQNQILDGVKVSAVTIFRMSEALDAGAIVKKAPLLLEGDITEIFTNLTTIGTALTLELLQDYPDEFVQNENEATYCSRRKPDMSEITVAEIQNSSAEYLYDRIRCLTGQYPRAYVTAGDGEKLYIEIASLSPD